MNKNHIPFSGTKDAIDQLKKPHTIEDASGLQDSHKLMAKMSSAAYQDTDMERTDIGDWKYNAIDSDKDFAVYEKGDETIIAVKGTSTMKNVLDDARLAINRGERVTLVGKGNALLKKLNRENITFTGHSLGGYVAATLAHQHGKESVVFNPGSSPLLGQKKQKEIFGHAGTHVIIKQGDLVSANAARHAKNIDIVKGSGAGLKAHFMDNFLEPEKGKGKKPSSQPPRKRRKNVTFLDPKVTFLDPIIEESSSKSSRSRSDSGSLSLPSARARAQSISQPFYESSSSEHVPYTTLNPAVVPGDIESQPIHRPQITGDVPASTGWGFTNPFTSWFSAAQISKSKTPSPIKTTKSKPKPKKEDEDVELTAANLHKKIKEMKQKRFKKVRNSRYDE
jgi:hypothetical protein